MFVACVIAIATPAATAPLAVMETAAETSFAVIPDKLFALTLTLAPWTVLLFAIVAWTVFVVVFVATAPVPAPPNETAPLADRLNAAETDRASMEVSSIDESETAALVLVTVEWSIVAVVAPPIVLFASVIAIETETAALPLAATETEAEIRFESIEDVSDALIVTVPPAVTVL